MVLGTLFGASSVLHAVRPGLFRPLVPTWLPGLADNLWVAWGRVPLQVLLIWAVLQSRPREPGKRAPFDRSITST